jgi:hypothetical protein
VLRKARVVVVSEGLPAETLHAWGLEGARTVEEALGAAARHGGNARVAVIPEGPYVLSTVRGELRSITGA